MILTAMVFTLVGLVRLVPPPTPTPTPGPRVGVIFTGIASFAKDKNGAVVVLFPLAKKVVNNGTALPEHQTYIRYRDSDLDHKLTTRTGCEPAPIQDLILDTVCYLDREKLEIAGPFAPGPVVKDQTFENYIVKSTDITNATAPEDRFLTWPVSASTPLAARFDIPGGTLYGGLFSDYYWSFEPPKSGAQPRLLGQAALLGLVLQNGSEPIRLRSSNGTELVFNNPMNAAEPLLVEIGQIMTDDIKKLQKGAYKVGDRDEHFYLHYVLDGEKCTPQPCPIPKRVAHTDAPAKMKKSAATTTLMGMPASTMKIFYPVLGHNCPPRAYVF